MYLSRKRLNANLPGGATVSHIRPGAGSGLRLIGIGVETSLFVGLADHYYRENKNEIWISA
jgi:hypothetical protein